MVSELSRFGAETAQGNISVLANTGFIVSAAITASSLILLIALIVRLARKGKSKPKEPPRSKNA